jgi:cupin fold WbuC family metalloprotein
MKLITAEVIESLLARAAATARKRINLNLHDDYADPINRFVNAGLCGTYVRPHRHRLGKWEIASVLQGNVDIIIFSPDGKIESRTSLSMDGTRLAEIPGAAPAAVVLARQTYSLRGSKPQRLAMAGPMTAAYACRSNSVRLIPRERKRSGLNSAKRAFAPACCVPCFPQLRVSLPSEFRQGAKGRPAAAASNRRVIAQDGWVFHRGGPAGRTGELPSHNRLPQNSRS